ncbi:type II toxin-antitoxin system PemK/MazF family toxin [Lactobacillus sp. PV034]|nr:type II toxin-antitoxin system PemK/MazF family toxin [Lactobacillus sp. PV034]
MIQKVSILNKEQVKTGKIKEEKPENQYHQGDFVWLNFSPSEGNEMRGKHPAVIVSTDSYNRAGNYVIVCPITSHGSDAPIYFKLVNYETVHGRVNCSQIHSFDQSRIIDKTGERMTASDFTFVHQLLSLALMIDY